MNQATSLPRILVIDDLFGRSHPDKRNEERATLCMKFQLNDVTGDVPAVTICGSAGGPSSSSFHQ